jgi:CMP-N,N'-diacetyllegionaminic acid synthase
MSEAIAIILARAGSKGVPGKNVGNVGGRPCIGWTIDQAKATAEITTIAVSSDDPRALALASEAGVIPLHRPADLASDTARVDDAARDALARLERPPHARFVTPTTPVVILYANCPVRPAGCISKAVRLLLQSGADSVQTYQPVGKHHPWWTARLSEDGRVSPWEGDVLNHGVFRRQDLPAAFIPDGAVLAMTARALRLEAPGATPGPHQFFGVHRRGIVNPEGSVVDIDSPLDVVVANAMLTPGGACG